MRVKSVNFFSADVALYRLFNFTYTHLSSAPVTIATFGLVATFSARQELYSYWTKVSVARGAEYNAEFWDAYPVARDNKNNTYTMLSFLDIKKALDNKEFAKNVVIFNAHMHPIIKKLNTMTDGYRDFIVLPINLENIENIGISESLYIYIPDDEGNYDENGKIKPLSGVGNEQEINNKLAEIFGSD